MILSRRPARPFLSGFLFFFATACGTDAETNDGAGGAPGAIGGMPSGGSSSGTGGTVTGAGMGGGPASSGGAPVSTGGTGVSGNAATAGTAPSTGGTPSGSGGGGADSGGASAGGSPPAGGTASGGQVGAGGSLAGSGGASPTPVACQITPTATVSSTMASVVTVTVETDLSDLTAGSIQFGKDTSYGYEAPLDVGADGYQTLLLGMPFDSPVHYRVLLSSPAGTCTGGDQSISTGAAPAGAPSIQTTFQEPDLVTPGFILIGSGNWATIWNHLGELVWAHQGSSGVTRLGFTYDARFLIARDGNPSGQAGQGSIRRLSLDGSGDEAITLDRSHHDFTATPDNGLVFFVNAEDNCGKLIKMSSDGTLSELYNVADAFSDLSASGNDRCHMNSIHYHDFDDSITFSVLGANAYVKISSQGELQWVLDGNGPGDFSGDGATWNRQHGHAMIDENHLIFFNNRGNGETSLIREVELDTDAGTATVVFEYDGNGSSQTLGDIQPLPSGNLLVTYCNDNLQREITRDKTAVREFEWTGQIGYATHRSSLYGPPPPR